MTPLMQLIEEAETEFENLEETIREVNELLLIVSKKVPSNIEKAAAIQYLSQYYNGIENILKRIIKYKKIPLIKSEQWHTELLDSFELNSNKSKFPLFNNTLMEHLNSYKKIPHVVRQGYNFQLDWERLSVALKYMEPVYNSFKNIITEYINNIE